MDNKDWRTEKLLWLIIVTPIEGEKLTQNFRCVFYEKKEIFR